MKTKGILSYLYYQDGEVLIDEFSPKEKDKKKVFSAIWFVMSVSYFITL